MKLLIHAGPMKTGSTFLQILMGNRAKVLKKYGITFQHIEIEDIGNKTIYQEVAGYSVKENSQCVILSSEFFSVRDCTHIKDVFRPYCDQMYTLMFYRALSEVYPSLYLQRIKGPVAEMRSFEEFANKQMVLDSVDVTTNLRGSLPPSFNYQFLHNRMRHQGFEVLWRPYSKQTLLGDFLSALPISNAPVVSQMELQPEEIQNVLKRYPLSPLRSLKYGVSAEAIEVNRAFHNNSIDQRQRRKQLTKLIGQLDITDTHPPKQLMSQINAFDACINGQFYNLMKRAQ